MIPSCIRMQHIPGAQWPIIVWKWELTRNQNSIYTRHNKWQRRFHLGMICITLAYWGNHWNLAWFQVSDLLEVFWSYAPGNSDPPHNSQGCQPSYLPYSVFNESARQFPKQKISTPLTNWPHWIRYCKEPLLHQSGADPWKIVGLGDLQPLKRGDNLCGCIEDTPSQILHLWCTSCLLMLGHDTKCKQGF
jgi:hypothetical protein